MLKACEIFVSSQGGLIINKYIEQYQKHFERKFSLLVDELGAKRDMWRAFLYLSSIGFVSSSTDLVEAEKMSNQF